MHKIDVQWLTKLCVDFSYLAAEDKETLVNKVLAELEIRVGNTLAEKLSDEQVEEFEKVMNNDDDALTWLTENYPDYPIVVEDEAKRLGEEITRSSDKVALIMSWAYPLPD